MVSAAVRVGGCALTLVVVYERPRMNIVEEEVASWQPPLVGLSSRATGVIVVARTQVVNDVGRFVSDGIPCTTSDPVDQASLEQRPA